MKKKLILLPFVMMALVACGGNTSDPSTEPSTKTEPSTTEPASVTPTPTPSVEDPSTEPSVTPTPSVEEPSTTPIPPVTGLTIDAAGMNMADAISGVYLTADHTFTIDGIEFTAKGSVVGLAKESYNAAMYSFNAVQIKKGNPAAITNTTAIEGKTTVTINWLAQFASEDAKYFPIVQAGTDATSLTAITANEAASAPLTGVDTGILDANNKNAYKYTTTYTIPEGSTFFSFGSTANGVCFVESIILA